ncbi:hypothetical protein SETIT_6G140000v2 [Setaria italica]|uniref:DUF4283 domain-containing protein n=1 Tax=Setaria italica TaxID=4555 RepID=A0A368RL99_SETIT|nr:hypothetical protein SETIT_6G140000v2 [Setaria italica]
MVIVLFSWINYFAEWSDEEEGLLIPKAWINIFRIPKKLRELPVLWALATNNNPFGRVLVSVIDSKAFPHRLCVVIGDRWYECPVRVESIIPRVKSYVEVIKHDDDPEGNDDDALGDDGHKDNNNGTRKKSKSGQNKSQTGVGGEGMDVDPNKNSDGDQNQQKVPEDQLRVMANEILDCVVSSLIGEVAKKVATAKDDSEGQVDRPNKVVSIASFGVGTRNTPTEVADKVAK